MVYAAEGGEDRSILDPYLYDDMAVVFSRWWAFQELVMGRS
jgi:hypothetical protein